MRLQVLAGCLVLFGCSAPPPAPPDFVDCQPLRDFFSFFSRPAFDVGPRMEPAGVPLDVAVAFAEQCKAELDLSTLRPAGSAAGPDNLKHPLEVRVSRETADDGRPMLVAAVTVTPDVPGWWLVELSLDPGWARHQVLVYVMENHADAPRHFESVTEAVSPCVVLQRVGGTFVCGDVQSRPGVPPGSLGGYPVAVRDTAWVGDGARVVRFEDSPTGLRTTGSRSGDLRPLQAEPGRVLAADFDTGGLRGYRVLGWDGGAELVDEAWAGPSSPVVLRKGELVPLCPGPACEAQLLAFAGDRLFFVRAFGDALERLPFDGGVTERIDLGPGSARALGPGLVDGRPLGVLTPRGQTALLHDLGGTPRVVWLGDDVVGVGDGVALVRGRTSGEVAVVPLDF